MFVNITITSMKLKIQYNTNHYDEDMVKISSMTMMITMAIKGDENNNNNDDNDC